MTIIARISSVVRERLIAASMIAYMVGSRLARAGSPAPCGSFVAG
jgi:hypothetical protein